MSQGTQTGALYQPRGVRWGGRWEGGSGGRGHMYIYGGFMLMFWQKTTEVCKAIILQLKNKLKKIKWCQGGKNKQLWKCASDTVIQVLQEEIKQRIREKPILGSFLVTVLPRCWLTAGDITTSIFYKLLTITDFLGADVTTVQNV